MCGRGAGVAALAASLLLVLAQLEACDDKSLVVIVHSRTLTSGRSILKVVLDHGQCEKLKIKTTDKNFAVNSSGYLVAARNFTVDSDKKIFDVQLQDLVTLETCIIHVQLLFPSNPKALVRNRRNVLRRQKRRWRPLPVSIIENDKGPFPKTVQYIKTEFEQNYTITYRLVGQGVDLPPKGLFTIVPETGEIRVCKPVDREEYPVLKLKGIAIDKEGFDRDLPLDLTIPVDDINDNAPEFTERKLVGKILEGSPAGTLVVNLTATDRDEPGTPHTQLSYRILSQTPSSQFGVLFSVNRKTGEITTVNDKIDREEHDKYTLKVEVKDMNGQPNGLFSTGTIVIEVTDANDNSPTFKESRYTVDVRETVSNILLLRIPIEDKDISNTEASRAVFKILKGNQNGNFNVTTDLKTNEGLLYLVKPLDAETTSSINLEITAENGIPLTGSSRGRQVTIVTVNVNDLDEGPEFVPSVKQLWTDENVAIGTDLGTYTAKDPETQSSHNIRYRKLTDPAGWVSIDHKTGQIQTTAILDRESQYVKNNKYNVTVLAIEDNIPARTGTGTVVINVNDVNDNKPVITNKDLYICENGDRHFVNISAEDYDMPPNSAPFKFSLDSDSPEIKKKWSIYKQMGSYALLKPTGLIEPGYFEVPILVQDQQDEESKETLKIIICECVNQISCSDRLSNKRAILGGLGVLMMFVAALLLLCLPLAATALNCGDKEKPKPPYASNYGYQQSLIVCSEEGGGQEEMKLAPLDISVNQRENYNMGQVSQVNKQGGESGIHSSSFLNTDNIQITNGMRYDQNGMLIMDQVDYSEGGIAVGDAYGTGSRKSHGLMEILRSQVDQVYEEEQEDVGLPFDYAREYHLDGANSVNGSIAHYSDVMDATQFDNMNNLRPKFGTLPSISLKK
ncbi:desmocollin 2-like protein [Narcine bancroftii]|uniref:desmocollin 2-like protein n=1 Tax=Narcine bancroftii TaxID=1343680 RepID=UPI0038322D06